MKRLVMHTLQAIYPDPTQFQHLCINNPFLLQAAYMLTPPPVRPLPLRLFNQIHAHTFAPEVFFGELDLFLSCQFLC